MTVAPREGMAETHLPEAVMRSTRDWSLRLAADWRGEVPTRIHNRDIANDGSPQWSPDFRRYLTRKDDPDYRNPEERLRTTRAFRLLRKRAVREFEVVYRLVALGGGQLTEANIQETADWLTARAERHGHPDRYDANDVLIMLHSGIDKVTKWR